MYINPKHKQADDNGGSAIPAAVGGAALGAGGYFAYKHLNKQGPSLAHRFMNHKLSKFMAGAGGVAAAGTGLWQAAKQVGKHMAAQGIDKAMRAGTPTGASGASTVVNAAKKQEAAKAVVQDAKATTQAPKVTVATPSQTQATTSTVMAKVPNKENKVVSQAAAQKQPSPSADHSFAISEMNKLKGQVQQAHEASKYPASFSQPGSDAMPDKFIVNPRKPVKASQYRVADKNNVVSHTSSPNLVNFPDPKSSPFEPSEVNFGTFKKPNRQERRRASRDKSKKQ